MAGLKRDRQEERIRNSMKPPPRGGLGGVTSFEGRGGRRGGNPSPFGPLSEKPVLTCLSSYLHTKDSENLNLFHAYLIVNEFPRCLSGIASVGRVWRAYEVYLSKKWVDSLTPDSAEPSSCPGILFQRQSMDFLPAESG